MSFQNAKIVATGADSFTYHEPHAERGSRDYVVSSSSLRAVFAKCPQAWVKGWTLPASDSLEYGSLFDCIVLTPELFSQRYAVTPDTYPSKDGDKPWNWNATFCKDWRTQQESAGKSVVSKKDMAEAQAAKDVLLQNESIKAFIESSDKQVWVTGEWVDEGTGLVVPVQCLIDLVEREVPLTRQRIGDLKTTKNAAPLAWSRWARFAGYDVQAAWNLDLFNAATGRAIEIFEFVLSESEFPYVTGRRVAIDRQSGDPEGDEGSAIVSGRRQYRRTMSDYCRFVKTGFWPGYDDTDESSGGATELRSDPYEEQRRMFAPRFQVESATEENCDVMP